MKRKLALLIAAVMTVAMVPATAFASTKLTAVDEITVGTDKEFTSRVELSKSNDQVDIDEKNILNLMYMQHLQMVSLQKMAITIRWTLKITVIS